MFSILCVAITVRVFVIFNFNVLLCRVSWYFDTGSFKSGSFKIFSCLSNGSVCALYEAPVIAN